MIPYFHNFPQGKYYRWEKGKLREVEEFYQDHTAVRVQVKYRKYN